MKAFCPHLKAVRKKTRLFQVNRHLGENALPGKGVAVLENLGHGLFVVAIDEPYLSANICKRPATDPSFRENIIDGQVFNGLPLGQ